MASQVRQPRVALSLGGTLVPCTDCDVDQSRTAKSSTFSAKVPLTTLNNLGMGLDWLAEQTEIDVSVSFAVNGSSSVMFMGSVDKVSIELEEKGQVVSFSGRDATSKLTDTKSNEKFINQKSEDICSTIAGRVGLSLQSDGGTLTAGKIYTAEQAAVTDNVSLMTLLRKLGETEGKVPFIYQNQISFKAIDDPSLPTYPIFYQAAQIGSPATSNAIKITLGRNYQAAKKTTVTVNSWDHKKKKAITGTASSGSGTPEQTYTYDHHHKTQDQVTKHAQSKLKEHTRHEFDVTIEMPGDTSLTPLYQIALSTGSGFDQSYAIDHIKHSMKDKYTMSISTKAAKKGRNSD